MIQFPCPACRQLLQHPTPGNPVKCPACGHRCDVPSAESVAAADPDPNPPAKRAGEKFCPECGQAIRARAEICPKCGVRQPRTEYDLVADTDSAVRQAASNKIGAGICGILLGGLGIHKFLIGATSAGLIMLLTSLFGWLFFPFTCGVSLLVPFAMWIIGLIEGIIYLTKTDEEFYRTYVVGRKQWF